MREIRSSGGATVETSYYGALETLLNAVGRQLQPRVIANSQIRNQGAGHPDFGLYAQSQCRGDEPAGGQSPIPERGVVEVKGLADDAWLTAGSGQVTGYWQRYGLVLVTNYRAFLLIGTDAAGAPVRLEAFELASDEAEFWSLCGTASASAGRLGPGLVEYLRRALTQAAPLVRPDDLAWLMASYARDALRRVEATNLPALAGVREGLEQALGMRFEGAEGEHFFRSTLVQTLFYGVFSAWVQWAGTPAAERSRFEWQTAGWLLRVPMVRVLFEQIATPTRLGPLGLVEVLDWTGSALNRVDRGAFFAAFNAGQAVQYFYEPFLAQFDPALREKFGVWYTPPEIVEYMVRRVDEALRTELGIVRGLADPAVRVLDPCCGTGSFIMEALRLIGRRLREEGDPFWAEELKQAALNRVFGFELMPAPFVIAHWQVGALLAAQQVALGDDERASVYLTNALTGWEPPTGPRQRLLIPDLEPERDAAERVKQDTPILVVIGNPPYSAFAGTSPDQEDGLVEPYKDGLEEVWGIRKYNLDELYVRFFRVAERRIGSTGRGVVSMISNYSWTEYPSFVVMRQHLLRRFDRIWIENLHGNREISERAPDGTTSETVFAMTGFSPGIRRGVTIGTMVRSRDGDECEVLYRDDLDAGRAARRREDLLASLSDANRARHYERAIPSRLNRLSFRPRPISADYAAWPSLKDLAGDEPLSGLSEKRRGALIDHDRNALDARMRRYLDPSLSFEEVERTRDGPILDASGFDARKGRTRILIEDPYGPSNLKRYAVHPLDTRWAYHTEVQPIWNRARPEVAAQVRPGTLFVASRMKARRPDEGVPVMATRALANHHLLDPNAHVVPTRLYQPAPPPQPGLLAALDGQSVDAEHANLSVDAREWLETIGWPDPDGSAEDGAAPWHHALAIAFSPAWLTENGPAILTNWPRLPLPQSADTLRASADLGRRLADLLDPDTPVVGVTSAPRALHLVLGRPARVDGGQLRARDLAMDAGWGSRDRAGRVNPGRGGLRTRDRFDAEALAAIEEEAARREENAHSILTRLGQPLDVALNAEVVWEQVPSAAWNYSVGGYQVFKKWLSYREAGVLGRPMTPDEVREGAAIVRRLTAIILLQPELDANYETCRSNPYPWPDA